MWLNRRGLLTLQIFACLYGMVSSSKATLVDWTNTLDASLIAPTGTVTYTDVNGEGYDIVVTTFHLFDQGCGSIGDLMLPTTSWWFEGYVGSPGGCGTVTFRFFETGTTNPIGVNGVNIRIEDAEQYERFANFAYWDRFGVLQSTLTNTDPVFSGPLGLTTSLDTNVIENATAYNGGTQLGKELEINLSSTTISGFTFDVFRTKSNVGSVEMTALGDLSVSVPDQGSTWALLGGTMGLLVYVRRKLALRTV